MSDMARSPAAMTRRCLLAGSAALGGVGLAPTLPRGAQAQDKLQALYEAAKNEKPMTWYVSFYGDDIAQVTAKAFAKKYPGLHVVAIRQTTGSIFQRVNQDLRFNSAVSSVLTMSGIGDYYSDLKRHAQLMQYVPANAATLSGQFKTGIDAGYVYPVGGGLMAIAYNSKNVTDANAPTSWDDLADPKWKNKLALSHPAFSGFDAALDVALTQEKGWDYFKKIARNNPLIQRSTFDTITAINSGERDVASMPDEVAIESAQKGNPLKVVYPSDGSILILGLTAILNNAPSPNTAKLFTEFLLGTEHARILAAAHYAPARPEVSMTLANGKTLNAIKLIPVVPSPQFGKELRTVIEDWRDLFGG